MSETTETSSDDTEQLHFLKEEEVTTEEESAVEDPDAVQQKKAEQLQSAPKRHGHRSNRHRKNSAHSGSVFK